MRLYREDWEKMDELFGKIGFGGYYDFLEVLKIGAYRLVKAKIKEKDRKKWNETIRTETDLKMLVLLINTMILRD